MDAGAIRVSSSASVRPSRVMQTSLKQIVTTHGDRLLISVCGTHQSGVRCNALIGMEHVLLFGQPQTTSFHSRLIYAAASLTFFSLSTTGRFSGRIALHPRFHVRFGRHANWHRVRRPVWCLRRPLGDTTGASDAGTPRIDGSALSAGARRPEECPRNSGQVG